MDNASPRIFELFDQDCVRFVKKFRSVTNFVTAFRQQYDLIIAYHGTNINDADATAIQNEGLKCATIELLQKRAEDRFVLSTDEPDQQIKVKELIAEQFINSNEYITVGEINFTMEKEPLQGEAYQYLLFGPESLFPVADHLRKKIGQNFRRRMMEYGTPTIVKAQVPVSKTADWWIEAIYGYWKMAD